MNSAVPMQAADSKPCRAWAFFLGLLVLGMVSCAPQQPSRNRDAMLPEIDVMQVKENGDLALKLAQQNRASLDNLSLRVAELERTVAQLDLTLKDMPIGNVTDIQRQILILGEEILQLRQALEKRGSAVPAFHPQAKTIAPQVQPPAPDAYRKGWELYLKEAYLEAITAFELFMGENPDNPWVDDAWYWTGESLLGLGDYARAISAFERVFTFARSDRSDDAQFQIGTCYARMGDRNRAAVEYKKVETLFPDSDYVAKARHELKKLQAQ